MAEPIGLNHLPLQTAPRVTAPDWLHAAMGEPVEQLAVELYDPERHPADEQAQAVAYLKATGRRDALERVQFEAATRLSWGLATQRQARLLSELNALHFKSALAERIPVNCVGTEFHEWRMVLLLATLEHARIDIARQLFQRELGAKEWPLNEDAQPVGLIRNGQRQLVLHRICMAIARPEVVRKADIVEAMLDQFVGLQMLANEAVTLAVGRYGETPTTWLIDVLIRRRSLETVRALKRTLDLTQAEIKIMGMNFPVELLRRQAGINNAAAST